jgi:hypothetical protein
VADASRKEEEDRQRETEPPTHTLFKKPNKQLMNTSPLIATPFVLLAPSIPR